MVDVSHLVETIRGRSQTAYARAGGRLERRLRETSPVKSGETRRQTRVVPRGPLRLETIVDTDYASYLRSGTAPHEIRPRTKKALAFFWEKAGANVVFTRVQHPGTDPNPWYNDALEQFPADVEYELRRLP